MTVNLGHHLAARVIRLLPRRAISRVVGQLCDAPLPPAVSRAVVGAYARAYRVDLGEVAGREGPYESFDAFFVRPLVEGARPICGGPGCIVSPADGRLQSMGPVEAGSRIVVKGRPYDVARLVGDETEAQRYVGGQFAVVYLSPRDYHRVHAPVNGHLVEIRSMPGDLYPVNAIGEQCAKDLLVVNRRVALVIDTVDMGRITMTMVAAMVVGRITVSSRPERDVQLGTHRVEPPVSVAPGQEVGAFHLGSTVVLLTGPQSPAWQREPGLVRVGESLARTG